MKEFLRRSRFLLLVIFVFAVALPVAAAAQAQSPEQRDTAQTPPDGGPVTAVSPRSPDASRLLQKAEREGSVRAIVGLRTDFVPEGRLPRPQAADQRDGIENAGRGLRAELAGTGYRTLREYDTVPYIALSLTPEAFRAIQHSPRVTTIQEDVAVPADLAESTTIVQAPTMWANPTTGAFRYTGFGKTIAVLDTGVDSAHPFLAGKVVEEACFSGGSDCPNGMTTQTGTGSGAPCTYAASGCQHGTHVAGIAAGQGSNFSGVAKGADIMAVQVFSRFTGTDCNGQGEDPCTLTLTSDQLAALEYVFQRRVDHTFSAVNMSLGGGQFTSTCDTDSRKAAIDNLRSISAATVIASGNSGFTNATGAPGCISSAITVGSTTKTDGISSFSNAASWVDLLAPGDSINSSIPGTGFGSMNGTSMAAPHVSGAWALLEHWDAGQTVSSITSLLQNTGTPVTDTRTGGTVTTRRINIADAANQRPPGDFFSFPQSLGGATLSVNGINGAATRESGEPDHLPASSGSPGENSVWYSWTAPASGPVTMNTCTSSFDTALAVYTGGSTFPSLTQVASDDDTCSSPNNVGSQLTFNAVNGTNYRIAVSGYREDTRGEGTFTLNAAYAPPANDNFGSAQAITGTSASVNSRNAGATREFGEPDHWSGGSLGEHSVWYNWTAPFSGPVELNTCTSSFDTVLAAYTGGSIGGLSQVASDDDACDAPNAAGSRLFINAVAGTTYRIAVSGFSASSEGTFTLDLKQAPPNDDFHDAQAISGNNATVNGTTLGATRESGEPDHWSGGSLGEHSVWYNWTAPFSGPVELNTCTSSFDTVLTAYTGSFILGLSQVASDDDTCTSPNGAGSKLRFNAVAGTVYRIAVSGFSTSSEGTFTLKVHERTPPTVNSTTPANNAAGVAAGANVTATFSEAMKKSTVNTSTFSLRESGTTTNVAAVVSYSATTKTAKLNPNANLTAGATYIAEVTTGAKDLAGNRLDQDLATTGSQKKTWTFSVN